MKWEKNKTKCLQLRLLNDTVSQITSVGVSSWLNVITDFLLFLEQSKSQTDKSLKQNSIYERNPKIW